MVKRTRSESREKNKKAKRKKHRSSRRDRRSSEDSRSRRSSSKSESKQNREYPSNKRSRPHSRERTRERSPYRQRYKDDRNRNDYQSNERKYLTMSRPLNYGRYEPNDERSSSDRTRTSLEVEINKMLTTEKHHTQHVGYRSSGEISDVIWCPRYVRPNIKHHIRGGQSLLHHRCRSCRQLCYHLLGRPGTKRLCLECSGWKRKYIPEWYFHKRCKYCYTDY